MAEKENKLALRMCPCCDENLWITKDEWGLHLKKKTEKSIFTK